MHNFLYLAFDPIFYLHHANVDRLLALWSAIHSNIWVTPGSSVDGTITIPPGSEISENTRTSLRHGF